jgi:hypothetical protein
LRYQDDFAARFEEYQRVNDEILPLAVENTNPKAQRLSVGPSREAAQAFHVALEQAIRTNFPRRVTACERGWPP